MSKELKVRCSSLPRFFRCASSVMEPRAPHNPTTEASSTGDAAHECMTMVVAGEEPDITGTCRKHNADVDEVRALVGAGRREWEKIKHLFPNPQAECALDGILTQGTSDAVHHDGKTAAVLDWKFGRYYSDYRAQVVGYAYSLVEMLGWPESGEVRTFVIWPRMGVVDDLPVGKKEIEDFVGTFTESAGMVGKHYAAGGHCTFCPRQLECTTLLQYRQSALSVFEEGAKPTRAKIGELYGQAQSLRKMLDQFDDLVKMELENGPLPISRDKQLELRTYSRSGVDPRKAWGVLRRNGFSEDEIAATLSMSLTKVRNTAAANGGKTAVQSLLAELEEKDAIYSTQYTRKTAVKRKD